LNGGSDRSRRSRDRRTEWDAGQTTLKEVIEKADATMYDWKKARAQNE